MAYKCFLCIKYVLLSTHTPFTVLAVGGPNGLQMLPKHQIRVIKHVYTLYHAFRCLNVSCGSSKHHEQEKKNFFLGVDFWLILCVYLGGNPKSSRLNGQNTSYLDRSRRERSIGTPYVVPLKKSFRGPPGREENFLT